MDVSDCPDVLAYELTAVTLYAARVEAHLPCITGYVRSPVHTGLFAIRS